MDTKTPTGRLPVVVGGWSAGAVVIGSWWSLRPADHPFARPGDDGFPTLLDLVPGSVTAPALVGVGVVGLAAVLTRSRPVLVTVGVLVAVAFGLLAAGVAPLALAGYAMAMFGPVVLAGTLVVGAWRWRGGPVALGLMVAIGAAAWLTGIADGAVLRRYVDVVTGSAAKFGPPAALTFLLAGAVLWGALAGRLALAGHRRPAWAEPDAAARWGRAAAFVAAACVLPYFLLRMTWLTPWPLGMSADELAVVPEIRLHGLLLGLAALAGGVLTLGLVSRWGEVWPRWVPVLRGRPVPRAAAVVPGALVAVLLTAAAVPMAIQAVAEGAFEMLLIFPFWLWGPALGLAVLGYALRRGTASYT
ncbi:hypothetical protein ACQEVB_19530 [Pseudonocardia sp. CA-107938]|uniref:hypothetical protein n=1 Tax=Pseudonocardia sp. CA-107938 TaxID=3240021 RepID=UPI003D8C5455